MHHQLESQIGICLSVMGQLEDSLRSLVNPWQEIVIEISPFTLQLGLCQMSKVILGLSDQFFGIEESVNEKTSTRDLSWNPTVHGAVKLPLRHGGTLHSTEAGPVTDPEELYPRQEHLNHVTTQVVGY
jgi:hypothetical protein